MDGGLAGNRLHVDVVHVVGAGVDRTLVSHQDGPCGGDGRPAGCVRCAHPCLVDSRPGPGVAGGHLGRAAAANCWGWNTRSTWELKENKGVGVRVGFYLFLSSYCVLYFFVQLL